MDIRALNRGLWTGDFRRLRFFDQPHGRTVQAAQFRFARFVFRKLHQVAAREKIAEALFLFPHQQIRAAQLAQKFLRRPLRRAEIKSLLQIRSRRVRNRNDKRFRLRNQSQRIRQFLFRADVRRNDRRNRPAGTALPPPLPEHEQNNHHRESYQRPPQPVPSVRNRHRRLDVADVVGGG